MIFSFLCAVLGASCADPVLAPQAPGARLPASLNVAPVAPRGCARFEIVLRSRDSAFVSPVDEPARRGCGPVRPVVAGAVRFDRARALLWLPVAIENVGAQRVRAPARLVTWDDSVLALAPAPFAKDRLPTASVSIDRSSADSVLDAAHPTWPGAAVWTLDTLLAPAGDTQMLGTGARSRIRWIELRVHPGVQRFALTFWAEAAAERPPVPSVAPESIPRATWDSLSAPENVIVDPPRLSGRVLRHAIYVKFRPGTPQAERQRAIEEVGGTVVGGVPLGHPEGFYLVRLEAGPGLPPDSISGPLLRAQQRLNGRASVEFTMQVRLDPIGTTYRRPRDGAGFARADWQVDRRRATGANWALEAINMPLAWGCAVGDSQTRVAVVDKGFYATVDAELAAAIDPASEYSMAGTVEDHGMRVMSVIGASGDNGQLMTGVLWRSRVALYDAESQSSHSSPAFRAPLAVLRAASAGNPVVNLSLGYQRGTSTPTTAQRDEAVEAARLLGSTIEHIAAMRSMPLLVISASNDTTDALNAGYAGVAHVRPDLQQYVIVVGSASLVPSGGLALSGFSNRGRLVDVVAPGERVSAVRNGVVDQESGASFAVPYVSGLAALVKRFDPTLSTAEIRQLVLDGASRGGRSVEDPSTPGRRIPVIDAYETMRLVAHRSRTPLCGNPLWLDGQKVMTARGDSAEHLFTAALATPESPTVYHDGRRIDLGTVETYNWSEMTRGWVKAGSFGASPHQEAGTTSYSFYGFTHDVDRRVRIHSLSESSFELSVSVHAAAPDVLS